MTRLPRPCLGAKNPDTGQHEDCGAPVVATGADRTARCERHQAMHEATRRPSSSARGYDRGYQAEREEALAPDPATGEPQRCQLRLSVCTVWATTLHHTVPVDSGRNVEAARRGRKIPACKPCNSALGKRALEEAPRPPTEGRDASGRRDEDDDDDWFPGP